MIDRGKFNLLGVQVDAVDYEGAVARIMTATEQREPYGVSALAVHGVMTGVLDEEHRYRLNHLELVAPDGQPVRWGINWLHRTGLASRVYGPQLMLEVCRACAERGFAIALFGGSDELLEKLHQRLVERFPGLHIAAAIPSKFRTLRAEEKQALVEQLQNSGARLVFVGLGCPRQEVWAFEFKEALRMPVIAVGAAFNFHAGRLSQAPSWMQRAGLEWLYRLGCEPRRLWRRYVFLNPYYLWLLMCQRLKLRRFPTDNGRPPQREILPG